MARSHANRQHRPLILVALTLVGLSVPAAVAATPTTAPASPLPSYVALDSASGRILVQKGDTVRRPIASLTKVMTALVVAERGNLGGRVLVTTAAEKVEPEKEGLVPGRRYRRITLLYSALLVSSNDSATALAIDAGRGSLDRFYALMNARAHSIGMGRTTYASPSGLDDTRNLSTAIDQARLARVALANPTVARIARTREYRTRWSAPTYAKLWVNHNKMLGANPGVIGLKTGWTTKAGGCLIVAEVRGSRMVIGVVLHSASIWTDMQTLLDRAFAVDT